MMRVGALLAAIAVVAVPIAVNGQDVAQLRNSNHREDTTRRSCRVEGQTGSRLGRVARCSTKQEEANNREDQRRTTERIQANRFPY